MLLYTVEFQEPSVHFTRSSLRILGSSLFADFHILKFVRKFSSYTEINNGFPIRYQLILIDTKTMSTTIWTPCNKYIFPTKFIF